MSDDPAVVDDSEGSLGVTGQAEAAVANAAGNGPPFDPLAAAVVDR